MRPYRMPKGVEHFDPNRFQRDSACVVRPYRMPKGVEHGVSVNMQAVTEGVRPYRMPKGVEHRLRMQQNMGRAK